MPRQIVDCTLRLPGDKAAKKVAEAPCGLDVDRALKATAPEEKLDVKDHRRKAS